MTLQEVEWLVRELEPRDRLKLVAGICGELSGTASAEGNAATRRERMLAAIERCEEFAGGPDGELDADEDLRCTRERRR